MTTKLSSITHKMNFKGPFIVGGMFGLELLTQAEASSVQELPFFAQPHMLLATARSAFALLARTLHPKTVWLPSYLCDVVMGAFPSNLMRVRFYPIDSSLSIADESWLAEIHANDMVIFIDYFGFHHRDHWYTEVRHRGAWVVQDASQALLTTQFANSHYVIYSPRKFVGVPDGGILMAANGSKLPDENLAPTPASWWLESTRASILRAEYDRHGGERTWFKIFQRTEIEGPMDPCRMSDLSEMILKHVVDWQTVARRRRDNYKLLASELKQIALFPDLPDEVVPLGFPIRLQKRNPMRQYLFSQNIYPPVHWNITGGVPPEFEASHQLANEIMTIPCDQRYDKSDMEQIVGQIKYGISR